MCQVSYDLGGLFPLVKGCWCSHGHFWSFSQEHGVIIRKIKLNTPDQTEMKALSHNRQTGSVNPAHFTSSRWMSGLSDALHSPVKQMSTLEAINHVLCVCFGGARIYSLSDSFPVKHV